MIKLNKNEILIVAGGTEEKTTENTNNKKEEYKDCVSYYTYKNTAFGSLLGTPFSLFVASTTSYGPIIRTAITIAGAIFFSFVGHVGGQEAGRKNCVYPLTNSTAPAG